jgi:hypothetical protein
MLDVNSRKQGVLAFDLHNELVLERPVGLELGKDPVGWAMRLECWHVAIGGGMARWSNSSPLNPWRSRRLRCLQLLLKS